MAANKQTLYELLGVSQNAALAEIKAAHLSRSRELIADNSGLTRDEVNFQLQVLDVALNTLSAQWSRDAYDAELAALASASGSTLPAVPRANLPSLDSGVNALQLADELHHTYKKALAESDARNSLVIVAESVATSASVLKNGFRVLAGLLVLLAVFKISMALFAATHQADMYAKEKASAEEKVVIQDYYQKHGVRPASRAEAEMLEAQARQEQNEKNKAEAQRRRQ